MRRRVRHQLSVDPNLSRIRIIQPRDCHQQRGLARPRRSQQRQEFPLKQIYRGPLQGDYGAVSFPNVLGLKLDLSFHENPNEKNGCAPSLARTHPQLLIYLVD